MPVMQIDMNVCSGCDVCETDSCLVNFAIHHDEDDNYYIDPDLCTLCDDDESELVEGLPNCVAYCPVPGSLFVFDDDHNSGHIGKKEFEGAEDYDNLGDADLVESPTPYKTREECGYPEDA